jgi:hypothetical protein
VRDATDTNIVIRAVVKPPTKYVWRTLVFAVNWK